MIQTLLYDKSADYLLVIERLGERPHYLPLEQARTYLWTGILGSWPFSALSSSVEQGALNDSGPLLSFTL